MIGVDESLLPMWMYPTKKMQDIFLKGIELSQIAVMAMLIFAGMGDYSKNISTAQNILPDKPKANYDNVQDIANKGALNSTGGTGNKATTNKGNSLDITPSTNHSTTTATPGLKGTPNSSVDIINSNGEVVTRRWFGPNGNQVRDVDFGNHGNPKMHPEWPHEHGPR